MRKWGRASALLGARRLALLLVAVLITGIVVDACRAPQRQLTTRVAIRLIQSYQRHVSPALDRWGSRCRFTPTCSRYAEAVLRKHGILAGSWLAARRIARCGPWTPAGTVDPPE